MVFVFISLAAAGGAVGVICLILLIIVMVRSRGVKWIDSIGIHFLTQQRNGEMSIVHDIITLENIVTYESFVKNWSTLVASYPLFTHLVIHRRFLWSYLKEDPSFSLSHHVFCVDEPITLAEVHQYCQQQILEPLRSDYPLWRAIIFSHLQGIEGSKSVILFRYHRCLADSITMMQLLLTESFYPLNASFDDAKALLKASFESSSMSEGTASKEEEIVVVMNEEIDRGNEDLDESELNSLSRQSNSLSSQSHSLSNQSLSLNQSNSLSSQLLSLNQSNSLPSQSQQETKPTLLPQVFIQQTHPPCGLASSSFGSYWQLVCTKKDKSNPLHPTKIIPSPKERIFQTKIMDITIDDLKNCHFSDLSLNDILLGCLFSSIQSFYQSNFLQMNIHSLHSFLWINRRANEFIFTPVINSDSIHLSNIDSTVLILSVPLYLLSPWDTAMNIHHQLWKLSSTEQPQVIQNWLKFWGWLPRIWGDSCFSSFQRRGSFSVSILPGPTEKMCIGGNTIQSIEHASPPVGNETCHFSILCYSNQIVYSIVADKSIMNEDDGITLLEMCNSNLQKIIHHNEV